MTGTRVPLRTALDSPASKAPYVRRLFHTIADRYDFITVLLSFGLDAGWKRRLVDLAGPLQGARALDLACGTGDIAFQLARRGATVAGLDITHRMVEIAQSKVQDAPAAFVVGDMMALPFRSAAADAVTTGYGLRNVPGLDAAIVEIARVLKPGGRLLSLDFNRPGWAPIRVVYLAYLTLVGSALGLVLHRDPDTYRYIPESVRRYPGAHGVADRLRQNGFDEVRVIPILLGFMTLHVAVRAGGAGRIEGVE
jgi:demethylmenaquinone methyltransferase / 2-methoxy-6-polyprenyl-1,4-benzoquinol methylase